VDRLWTIVASLVLVASAGTAVAADAVIAPGPLSAPPAFPAQSGPVVRPGPFDAPPAYGPPPFRVYKDATAKSKRFGIGESLAFANHPVSVVLSPNAMS
jgi:hypothetical protein